MNGDRGTSHRAANSSGKGPPRETWRFASSSLAVAAVVISLSTLWANDGPRKSTKKMATFESPAKQQTDGDAQKSKTYRRDRATPKRQSRGRRRRLCFIGSRHRFGSPSTGSPIPVLARVAPRTARPLPPRDAER